MRSIIHEEHMHSICKQCLPSHYISVVIPNVTEQSLSHGTVLLGLRLHKATSDSHVHIHLYTVVCHSAGLLDYFQLMNWNFGIKWL